MSLFNIVRDEPALRALGPAWDALETRALAAGHTGQLYASHRYVSLVWQHLRQPGDRLHVLTLSEGGVLQAVLPLVLRRERVSGLPLRVLRPIGIWEGERPGVLCEGTPDAAWAALWQGLVQTRAEWHVLDLRELDEGSWPLRQLPSVAGGFRVTQQADTAAPWQALNGTWAGHEASRPVALRDTLAGQRTELARRAPGLRTERVNDPAATVSALDRCLALEATQPADRDLYLLRLDAARVAFYRAFLPVLAARGEAELAFLVDGDQDLAAVMRLRCGGVWLERHAAEHAAYAATAPAVSLLLGVLAQDWQGGAQASDLLLLPDASGRAASLRAWYSGLRPTWRLSVWNLRSRMGLLALLARLRGR